MADGSHSDGDSPVLYEQDGAIVTVTLNRPAVMNNFGGGLFRAVGEAADRFAADDSARVMILTGNGKAFCAGADLKAIGARLNEGGDVFASRTPESRRAGWFENPKFTHNTAIYKPVIGAINGYCFAGGLELALTCHFLIAAESAEFGVLNRRWAVPLVDGGTYRLPLWVGLGNALYLIQTGARIDAREAHRMGLVQEVVPDASLLPRARELAEIMAAVPQSGLIADTESALRNLGRDYNEALALEMAIGSTVEISGEALARFASGTYEPRTGGPAGAGDTPAPSPTSPVIDATPAAEPPPPPISRKRPPFADWRRR